MIVLTEGHKYLLTNFERPDLHDQAIQFIEKVPKEPGSKELKTVFDGTTNEDVLDVLIDRMYYLNKKFPCRENSLVITRLEEARMWLSKRTLERKKRGVEGKNEP